MNGHKINKMRFSQCAMEGCEKYFSFRGMKKHIIMCHANSIDFPMHRYPDKICDDFQRQIGCNYFEKQGKKCMWGHECSMCKKEGHSVQWCPLTLGEGCES